MIVNPGAVYKSTCPETHREIVAVNDAERERLTSAQCDLARALVPDGVAWGTNRDDGAAFMTGIRVASSSVEVPAGLRWDTKAKRGQHILVPARKTPEGKAIQAQMDALDYRPKSLGAVSEIVVISNGTHDYFAAAAIEVLGEDVFATYGLPVREGRDRDRVEADENWTPVPLSEFHAAREAAQVSA